MLNAPRARWFDRRDVGRRSACRGRDWQVGYGLYVLAAGEPMAMYHWETDQEDFLVLSGEALLVVEGERP